MPIKAIIFDFGNVLASFDHMKTCRRLAERSQHTPEEVYDLIFKSGLEKQYDEGMSWNAFHKNVCETLGVSISQDALEDIWGDIFSPNQEIMPVLESIPSDIKLFLLSNTNEVHWKYISQLPVIQKFFSSEEQQILSFRIGARKPDKEIYQEGIRRASVDPSHILYIDDIAEYAEAFEQCGGRSITYNCTRDSIATLKDKLRESGVSL